MKDTSHILQIHLQYVVVFQGKFRLEGESFPTITHLVDYHRKHQCPVTKKTNALLKNPVSRPKGCGKTLTHDDIIVETKLGRGHFGDVMKGRLTKTGEQVAVKTCRDNVIPAMKEKFLQEAAILAQYDHPNIVKLIGVAVDQEPVYIGRLNFCHCVVVSLGQGYTRVDERY